jgi:hypothetical protein
MSCPYKLECYKTLGRKGLPGTNTLAYWSDSLVTKKMKCCEYTPSAIKPFTLALWAEAGLLNKSSCLAPALGATKFIIVTAVKSVTFCGDT